MKLFNFENIDFEKEELFLGTGRNLARLELDIEYYLVFYL